MKYPLALLSFIFSLLFTSCSDGGSSQSDKPVYNADPYNGVMTTFYEDGKTVQQTFEMKDSIKHGKATQFYTSGEVNTVMTFEQGIRIDTAYAYMKSGRIYRKTPYQEDEKHGLQIGYFENGDVMFEMPYAYGEPLPGLKEYKEDGTLIPEPVIKFEKQAGGSYRVSIEPTRTKVEYYNTRMDQDGIDRLYTTTNLIDSKRGKCEINSARTIGAKIYTANKACYLIFGRP